MADRSYPFSQAILGNVRLGASEADEQNVVSRLVNDITRADENRRSWLDRQQALTRLRFGIRKPKNFPWPKASNLGIPLVDSQIRRMKPLLLKLLTQPDPIVEFVGEDARAVEAERTAEAEYNWLFKTKMSALDPMIYTIDSILHRGYGVVQVGWEYKTEYECRVVMAADMFPQGVPQNPDAIKAKLVQEFDLASKLSDRRVAAGLDAATNGLLRGEPGVKVAFKRVIDDRPALWDREPVTVIVPPRTTDYGSAAYVCVQHIIDSRTFKQRAADGFFSKSVVADILADVGDRARNVDELTTGNNSLAQENNLDDERERIWGREDEDNILIWEIYTWFDIDGDGLLDRVVLHVHPRTGKLLSSRPFALPFHRWPFVKFDFEKTSRRWHSPRGISAMLESLNREVNAQHNARIDAMTLHNAPIYQTPIVAGFKAKAFRAVPGSTVQVPLGSEIKPMLHDRASFPESVNEENLLRNIAEGYVGAFDNTLVNAASDRRTATEVNAAVQLAASTASLDTILFQLQMREVHELIWELWLEFRPNEVSYKVLGTDPNSNEPQLTTVKKSEINQKFRLFPTGTIANTNHALELSNAREAMQFFLNDQSGFVNGYELRKWYTGLLDYRIARRLINPPQQAQELQTLRQAAASIQADPGLLAQFGGTSRPPPEPTEMAQLPLG